MTWYHDGPIQRIGSSLSSTAVDTEVTGTVRPPVPPGVEQHLPVVPQPAQPTNMGHWGWELYVSSNMIFGDGYTCFSPAW